MAGEKGSDAKFILLLAVVWIVCTIALGMTDMVMYGVSTAWMVGFSFFIIVGGVIWWADKKGAEKSADDDGDDASTSEE